MPYHTNHATFELPAQLKDKTMHMFTLADDGPSEVSMAMSYTDAQGDHSLVNFADRLVTTLGKSLARLDRALMFVAGVAALPLASIAEMRAMPDQPVEG